MRLSFLVGAAVTAALGLAVSPAAAQTPGASPNAPHEMNPATHEANPSTPGYVIPQEEFYKRAPDSPQSSYTLYGLRGIEFSFRGGLMIPESISPVLAPNLYAGVNGLSSTQQRILTGDILGGLEKPYSYAPFGLSFTLGYRILRYLSVGAFFDYASFLVNDGTDSGDYTDQVGGSTSQLNRQVWQLGAYARMYFTGVHPRLHPWIEVGAGYSQDTASFVRPTFSSSSPQPLTVDYYVSHYGLATSLRAGLDWRLAPIFSVGPVVGLERVFGLKGCVDAEPQSDQSNMTAIPAVNTCSSSIVETSGYTMGFLGIFAKVTLGPEILR